MILAIDPGIRGCGVAVFGPVDNEEGERLHFARYVKNPLEAGDGPREMRAMACAVRSQLEIRGVIHPAKIVIEWPQTYQGSKQKGDPNDLLTLAGVDMAICMLFDHSTTELSRYRPREWKGQVDANETAERILKRLSLDECKRVDRLEEFLAALERARKANREVGGTDHNSIDAIGIGLKQVGRFDPHRVIAR